MPLFVTRGSARPPWTVASAAAREGSLFMAASLVRVTARQSVVAAHGERRRQRQERKDRIAAFAIEVSVALASGRAAMDSAEQAAGRALNSMLGMGLASRR